jgi:hypothetical protein
MLTLIVALSISGVIVMLIDGSWNNWYDSLVSARRVIVEFRVRNLDSRDVNYLLEYTGRYVEMSGRLYVNNLYTMVEMGPISNRTTRRLLVDMLGGIVQ